MAKMMAEMENRELQQILRQRALSLRTLSEGSMPDEGRLQVAIIETALALEAINELVDRLIDRGAFR